MTKHIHKSLILLLLFFLTDAVAQNSSHLLKEPNVLAVCSYTDFKPISYGVGQGYEADLVRAIGKQWHVKVKFYPEHIYDGIWRLPSREYTRCDAAIGGITPMEHREKEGAAFTVSTLLYDQSLLIRKKDYESGLIVSYNSFKNSEMKIGVVRGTTGEQFAHIRAKEAELPMSVFVQYPSEAQLLPALLNGKIDAIARGEIGNRYQASLNNHLMVIAPKSFNDGFSFALDPKNKPLLEKFNQSILDITHNEKIGYSDWLKDHQVFMKNLNIKQTSQNQDGISQD